MQMSAPFEQLIRRLGKLSIDCDRLSKWMESNRFKLNTDNTHFMIMGTAARFQLTETSTKFVQRCVRLYKVKIS